jgi:hypothetical protein
VSESTFFRHVKGSKKNKKEEEEITFRARKIPAEGKGE